MRARECATLARPIVAEVLGHKRFKVECPPYIRRKGVKGDKPHYGRIIMLTLYEDSSLTPDLIDKIASEVVSAIDDVNTLTLDITSVAALDAAAFDKAWSETVTAQRNRWGEEDQQRRRKVKKKQSSRAPKQR